MKTTTLISDAIAQIRGTIEDKKAENIIEYSLIDKTVSDCVLVASVNNVLHASAIVRDLQSVIHDFDDDVKPYFNRSAGLSVDTQSGWSVIDFNTVVIHLLVKDLRDYYDIDSWFATRSEVVDYD